MHRRQGWFFLIFFLFFHHVAKTQSRHYTVSNAHSHNDYEQQIPYWLAYNAGFGSIEADIFLVDTVLYVAHDQRELRSKIALEKEYLKPIDSCLKMHNGFPYDEPGKKLQILVDIKSDSIHTLEALIRLLKKYPALIHCSSLRWVITGNRPDPALFTSYPVFISFDGELHREYSRDALSRIVLLSDDFKNYSRWNGEKNLSPVGDSVLRAAVKKSHTLHKPVRFWDAPDQPSAWEKLMRLQVDYINTDHIAELASFMNHYDSASSQIVHEDRFISIGGIDQWVTIRGKKSKPVILFLHGGPGSVLSPYADHLYKDLEKDFILVQWDQRGAGRTFGRMAPAELNKEYFQTHPLTIERISDDGILLVEYLCRYLGKQKVILFGSSWGSALGVTMVSKRPGLFLAYVGHSQVVNLSDDERLYNRVNQLAEKNNDTGSLNKLREIGRPPYDRARKVGQLWRLVKKYESLNSVPAPEGWFVPAPEYDNAKDENDRSAGDDYSFASFVGDRQLGILSMRSSVNFLANSLEFKVPVYFIQGEEDILTPNEITRLYFDHLHAPEKKFILLPGAAHGFNQSVVDTQCNIFRSIPVN